jgi:DNA invertase Pin-like site-specific DNA recombinase
MPQGPAVPARAVLYARVSSKEQEKDGFSIPAQQKLLRHYAAENAIHVAKSFTDMETAKRSGRTGFGEMIVFLRRTPSCQIILVEKRTGFTEI